MNETVVEDHFDPKVHLQYTQPAHKYTFDDLGLQQSASPTAIAASSPFPFLSPEGVKSYRKAITAPEVLKNCAYSPFKNTLALRNVAKYSVFIKELWTHPETLRIIQDVAGIPLVPVIPYEIGHTNIQVEGASIEEMTRELSPEPSTATRALTEAEKAFDPLKGQSIIPWHYDFYPYVMVFMLSNTIGMHGGETYIKKGDGTALKVEGPSIGHCVFLQGGKVQHIAARAVGVDERIATITSLRADVPGDYDSSYLTNVRPVSDRPTLYREWVQYRLKKLKDEISSFESSLEASSSEIPISVSEVRDFADTQIAYVQRTANRLVDYELHDRIVGTYGQQAYYAAEDYWRQVQKHPDFVKFLQLSDDKNFYLGPRLCADLYTSRAAIANGTSLQGQLGDIQWDKERPYVMGDELLRQGLRERFFEWLGITGLDRTLNISL